MTEATPTTTDRAPVDLKSARALHKPADDLIHAIYEKRTAWSALQTAQQEKVRAAYATVKEDADAAMAWQRLRNHLGHRTGLFAIEPVMPHLGPQPGNTFLDAMLQLALYWPDWQREPEAWQPTESTPRAQFGSLARHLLSHYYVPAFLEAAWFEGFTASGQQHRNWFVHIGNGQNVRRAELPLRLTEKAAHHFLHAPDESTIVAALRWGQTLALGGDAYLANALAASKLGEILLDEPFWESVIHFFVNHPEMDVSHVGPIVDFIYAHRFGEQATPGPNGEIRYDDAPEPDFTMKGRTVAALQKRVQEWHELLARESKRPRTAWKPSGIEPFYTEARDAQKANNVWTVVELLSSQALQAEGREQKHCVFTYAAGCLNGTTSIWSLRVRPANDVRTRRLLTIEVNMTRRAIVQVRGRCNKTLGSFRSSERMRTAGVMLRRWAKEQRLSVACGL